MGTEEMLAIVPSETLDFVNNKVEVLTLSNLAKTVKENDINGMPMKGMYHYQIIERVIDECKKNNLNYEVEEVFAAKSGPSSEPGVTEVKEMKEKYGDKSIQSYALRRVYCTINIHDWETEEMTTAIAIAYHQDGVQFAIGPRVTICHNQCVLGAERSAKTYGPNKLTLDQMFDRLHEWLSNFKEVMTEDRERVMRMKNRIMSAEEIYAFIGLLVCNRVTHDSEKIRKQIPKEQRQADIALNQSQISAFTENLVLTQMRKKEISAWDIYNCATELYKPTKAEIPTLFAQNAVMADMILNY